MSQQLQLDPSKRPNLAELQLHYQQSLMSHHELESLLASAHAQLKQSHSELLLLSQQLAREVAAHTATAALLHQLQSEEEIYQCQCAEQLEQIQVLRSLLHGRELQLQVAQEEQKTTAAQLTFTHQSPVALSQQDKQLQTTSDAAMILTTGPAEAEAAAGAQQAVGIQLTRQYSSCLLWLLLAAMQLPALPTVAVAAMCIAVPLLLLLAWCGTAAVLLWASIWFLRSCIQIMQQSFRVAARYRHQMSITGSFQISSREHREFIRVAQ